MSKYEDFFIMKTRVFLIALGFIQLVSASCNHELNITDYDLYSVCPIHFFRRKRLVAEYTRWRGNQDLTTNEFLVKVLDEDMTTPNTLKVVAVNIQPVTAGGEKIIIGGAKVPPPTSALATTDGLKDYTRFAVPPTTPIKRPPDAELLHAQRPPLEVTFPAVPPPIQPKGINVVRNSQRDDSPPASPQFLARTPMLLGRQYAPIAPVAFNRRTNIAPVTPPSTSPYDPEFDSYLTPTRGQTFPDIIIPTRITNQADEFQKFHSFEELTFGDSSIITRSSYPIPGRTITQLDINEVETEFESTSEKTILEDSKRRQEELKKVAEKDSESSYNLMFYNDEDGSDLNSKKDDQDINDNYFDKKGNHEGFTETNTSYSKEPEMDYIDPKNYTFIKDSHTLPEEYPSGKSTDKILSSGIVGIPAAETTTIKDMNDFRDKRRPFCSLLTLRELNFNSPRTLPEITNQLKLWANNSPVTKCIDLTGGNFTTMENPIYMMVVDDLSSGQIVAAKQTVMIVAGIQGRDHHAVTAAMYVLYQLIERSEAHSDLLTRYRFWIVPVFNPDGYDYSMTFPHRREWTKNLRQSWDVCKDQREACEACDKYGLRCLIQPCYGVNLDRNFEYQWIPAEERRAEHPCGGLYSGVRQLSELETRALTQFLHHEQHTSNAQYAQFMKEQHTSLYTFIAFKEGDILGVMYPHSHTKKKRVFDHIFRQRALRAAAAASSISNRPYVGGQTSEFLPLYAGGIEDWVDGHLGVDNTYTIMMFRPADSSYNSKLITEKVVHEAYAAMDTLLLQSIDKSGPAVPSSRITLKRVGGPGLEDPLYSSSNQTKRQHLLIIIAIIVIFYG